MVSIPILNNFFLCYNQNMSWECRGWVLLELDDFYIIELFSPLVYQNFYMGMYIGTLTILCHSFL